MFAIFNTQKQVNYNKAVYSSNYKIPKFIKLQEVGIAMHAMYTHGKLLLHNFRLRYLLTRFPWQLAEKLCL